MSHLHVDARCSGSGRLDSGFPSNQMMKSHTLCHPAVMMKKTSLPVGERWCRSVPISRDRVNKFPLKNSIVRFRVQPDGVLLHRVWVDLVVDVLDQAVLLPPGLEADQLPSSSEANQVPLLPVAQARVSPIVDKIFVVCSCIKINAKICSQTFDFFPPGNITCPQDILTPYSSLMCVKVVNMNFSPA